jgi:hypothetical protein
MDKGHIVQDLYKLADEIKNKHGGFVVFELQSMNGFNRGIKLHYFKNMEEAVEHIYRDMEKGEKKFEKGERSISLTGMGEEELDQEFIVVDKDRFEQMVEALKMRLSPRRSEEARLSPREEWLSNRRSEEARLSPRRSEEARLSPREEWLSNRRSEEARLSPRRSEEARLSPRRSRNLEMERSRLATARFSPSRREGSMGRASLWEEGLSSRGVSNY